MLPAQPQPLLGEEGGDEVVRHGLVERAEGQQQVHHLPRLREVLLALLLRCEAQRDLLHVDAQAHLARRGARRAQQRGQARLGLGLG